MTAEKGFAKRISFNPLVTRNASIPADAQFVIAKSLREHHLAGEGNKYNQRVAECRLACNIILKLHLRTLGEDAPLTVSKLLFFLFSLRLKDVVLLRSCFSFSFLNVNMHDTDCQDVEGSSGPFVQH